MSDWRASLGTDPVPRLLASDDAALVYFTRRDLLNERVELAGTVWKLPEVLKILQAQQADGSWGNPGDNPVVYPPGHDSLVETFKQFRALVTRYGFTRRHPAIPKAARFLFSFQAPEGDIRGFIGNQYATYYTGETLALAITAGYETAPRVEKGLRWLLSMRQDDGGWTVPLLTHKYDRKTWLKMTSQRVDPVLPDRAQPFSHNWTDMALRAFAAHTRYRQSPEARAAGALLKSSFFREDAYTSYKAAYYWTRFLFWWPNLLTALNSLYLLGFPPDDPDIKKGLDWFLANQQPDGLWKLESFKQVSPKDLAERLWLTLNICRMLKRYYG